MLDRAPVDDRISAAFQDGASIDLVESLIEQVEATMRAAAVDAEHARERALDPTLVGELAEVERKVADDLTFRRDRLSAALPKLQERLRELQRANEDGRRAARYSEARDERDRLADELRLRYPKLAAELSDLLARVARSNETIARVNEKLPKGRGPLSVCELIARDLDGFVIDGTDVVRIVGGVRLPAFKHDRFKRYAWPPSGG
jgi:hypothetical protein